MFQINIFSVQKHWNLCADYDNRCTKLFEVCSSKGECITMNKKKGFILYFDILGYKEILKHNSEDENDRIAEIIHHFSDYYSKSNFALGYGSEFDNKKLFVRSFSDNFLFVYELEKDDFIGLAILQLVATRIQYQFLTVGLLTRGSITYGEILENDNIVFGLDLIHAVELEEGHRMPSIVVDPSLKYIFDGKEINYKEEVELFDAWPTSKLDYEDCVKCIECCLDQINKTYADTSVLNKIEWVINKLNTYFEKDQKTKYTLVVDYKCYLEKQESKL